MYKLAIASAFALAAQAAQLPSSLNTRVMVAGESRIESTTLSLGQTVELCYPKGHDHANWTYAVGQDSEVLTALAPIVIEPKEGMMGAPTTICARFTAIQAGKSLVVFTGKGRNDQKAVIDYKFTVENSQPSNEVTYNPLVDVEVAGGYGSSIQEQDLTMKSIFRVCWNDQHDSVVYSA